MSQTDHVREEASAGADEQATRERAYSLWEADGRPEGRMDEYWFRARELMEREAEQPRQSTPGPADAQPA